MEFLKALLAMLLSMVSIFNIFEGPHHVSNPTTRKDFEYLEYPSEAIINPEDAGLTLSSFKSQNITFTNCTAWNGKARCFGICGEVNLDIKDIKFKDSSVIFHDATWDANRIPAIAIIVENSGGSISNVTFENMDIYYAASRPIGCLIYNTDIQNFSVTGIKYKNITCNYAGQKNKVAGINSTNTVQAEFENIYYNDLKMGDINSGVYEYDSYASVTVK